MEKYTAIQLFESLSSGVRLDIYRLLVKRGLDGLVAGEIAAALALPANSASFHLKGMTQAGLLTVQKEGRFQRYRANLPQMLELIAYLTEECCAGQPERCGAPPSAAACCPAVAPPPITPTVDES